jgi:hypothetical protein
MLTCQNIAWRSVHQLFDFWSDRNFATIVELMKAQIPFLLIPLFILWVETQIARANEKTKSITRPGGDVADCMPPLKNYRAFITIKAENATERGGWELYAPGGNTPDLIDCDHNLYATIDAANGLGRMVKFRFVDSISCNAALNKLKSATKEFPGVVVIDQECRAHLAD